MKELSVSRTQRTLFFHAKTELARINSFISRDFYVFYALCS